MATTEIDRDAAAKLQTSFQQAFQQVCEQAFDIAWR